MYAKLRKKQKAIYDSKSFRNNFTYLLHIYLMISVRNYKRASEILDSYEDAIENKKLAEKKIWKLLEHQKAQKGHFFKFLRKRKKIKGS